MQTGAQLFALSVVVRRLIEAPPKSFAMMNGPYGYSSAAFWETMPMITLLLFVVALIANFKTPRRKFILLSLAFFIAAGLIAGFVMGPAFDEMVKSGYSDSTDQLLHDKARRWYLYDWMTWIVSVASGIFLLVACITPAKHAEPVQ